MGRGLLTEYLDYLEKYQNIYGPETIVLYQNGHFYECYGVDNDQEKVGLVKEVSQMLNIQMTRRNKEIIENDRSNFLMAGFPLNQLERYATMLIQDYNYVVVVVQQVTPPPEPKREVTRVITPGTNAMLTNHPSHNYLVSLYFEHEGDKFNQLKNVRLVTIGLSAIDASTGHSLVYQVGNMLDDESYAYDEIYRCLQTLQPREVIINIRQATASMTQEDLLNYFDLTNIKVHYACNSLPPAYYKISYQNQFFGKIFKNTGMLQPIEYLNLETYPTTIISYMVLLDYCHQQTDLLLKQIDVPVIWKSNHHMILDNNCLNQLNVIEATTHQKYHSLCNLLNQASTPMGKRLFKERLTMPLLDSHEIEERYDYLEFFRQEATEEGGGYRYQLYENHLKNIIDLERLHRKICWGILNPSEFNQLDASYGSVMLLLQMTEKHQLPRLVPVGLIQRLSEYIEFYRHILDLDETTKYNLDNIDGSFFKQGYHQGIDQLNNQKTHIDHFFNQLTTELSQVIAISRAVTHRQTDDYGYHLTMTTARYKTLMDRVKEPIKITVDSQTYTIDLRQFEVIKNRSGKNCFLVSQQTKEFTHRIKEACSALSKEVSTVYQQLLTQINDQFKPLMMQIINVVSLIDVYKSNAKTSILYNYCRPVVSTEPDKESYLEIQQLRHPLIERLQQTCPYVPQNVVFNASQQGILLFGVNCSGKSSLMKAIGLSIIMAQSGMYVPASVYHYSPFKSVLTRILGHDNIFRGHSSFAVEMSELRGILKRAGPRSLVLGDEVCHGTETVSAVSIVTSAVITLLGMGSKFLFATHLHQLSRMDRITSQSTLKMFHLKVKIDAESGQLFYDRRLEVGAGPPIYGLEVAKAMEMDRDFLQLANEIRRELTDTSNFVSLKKSRYNAQIYLDHCHIPTCSNQAELTHHIQFQKDADVNGYNGHIPKNHQSNLVPLCRKCHDMLHDEQPNHWRYVIKGYIMSSNGPVLDYEKIQNPPVPDADPLPVTFPVKKHILRLKKMI
jgi:DNA mismatch repair protein MutS